MIILDNLIKGKNIPVFNFGEKQVLIEKSKFGEKKLKIIPLIPDHRCL